MKKYISGFVHMVRLDKLRSNLITYHHRLNQVQFVDGTGDKKTPYQLFFLWVLDTVQYGTVIAITCYLFLNLRWQSFIWVVMGTGLLRWLCIDTVREISNAIRGK